MDPLQRNLIKSLEREFEAIAKDRACGKKIKYHSEETAIRVAGEMQAKHNKHFDAYQCWYCNDWHIGKDEWDDDKRQSRAFYGRISLPK